MVTRTTWNQKMSFTGEGGGNSVAMDASPPIGAGAGLTPKELLAIAVAGCSAMDVVALMKKYKEPLESLDVVSEVTLAEPGVHPAIFKGILLKFNARGTVSLEKLLEAIHLSQSKYCSVSAMVGQAVPIRYSVVLNGLEVGNGDSGFSKVI